MAEETKETSKTKRVIGISCAVAAGIVSVAVVFVPEAREYAIEVVKTLLGFIPFVL